MVCREDIPENVIQQHTDALIKWLEEKVQQNEVSCVMLFLYRCVCMCMCVCLWMHIAYYFCLYLPCYVSIIIYNLVYYKSSKNNVPRCLSCVVSMKISVEIKQLKPTSLSRQYAVVINNISAILHTCFIAAWTCNTQDNVWGSVWFHAWLKYMWCYASILLLAVIWLVIGCLIWCIACEWCTTMQIWFQSIFPCYIYTPTIVASDFIKQQMLLSVIRFLTSWVAHKYEIVIYFSLPYLHIWQLLWLHKTVACSAGN